MSENQKCLNLIRGGDQQFSKMSEIQKSLKFPMGRGGQACLGIFPKFFVFFEALASLESGWSLTDSVTKSELANLS